MEKDTVRKNVLGEFSKCRYRTLHNTSARSSVSEKKHNQLTPPQVYFQTPAVTLNPSSVVGSCSTPTVPASTTATPTLSTSTISGLPPVERFFMTEGERRGGTRLLVWGLRRFWS